MNNASPTLLNNIVAGLATGLNVDFSSRSTVVGGTLYHGDRVNSTGVGTEDFPVVVNDTDPLFRDPLLGNLYLASQSAAIDSSIGSLLERFDLKEVKNILGIADSPILAPETDVTGQLRVDDPQVETPAGFGDNVFIDRGAVDRADFVGPTINTVNPRDNDAAGLDHNSAPGTLQLDASAALPSFQIRLTDGVPPADPNFGSGVDDTTVTTRNVIVTQNGVPLVDGIDYLFGYNATSDTIVLTPLSGIWNPNKIYQVQLNNLDRFRLVAKPGPQIADGQGFEIRSKTGPVTTFEFESGYTVIVPQTLTLTVPPQGGSLGGVEDGQTFSVQRVSGGSTLQTAVFEFDSNGVFTDNNRDGKPDNLLIPFTVASTPDQIANAIVQQLILANIGPQPAERRQRPGRSLRHDSPGYHRRAHARCDPCRQSDRHGPSQWRSGWRLLHDR